MGVERCRRCPPLDGGDGVEDIIGDYVSMLPPELLAGPDVYEKRLAACSGCVASRGGMCAHCGCYVRARAAKAALDCPHPSGSLWPPGP